MMLTMFTAAKAASTASLTTPTNGEYLQTNSAGSAGFRIDADGYVYTTNIGGTYVQRYLWLTAGAASDFSVRVTATGGSPGSFTTGTAGSYLALTSSQTWTRNSGGAGSSVKTVSYTIDIALTSNTAEVVATCTGTLTAENNSGA